MSTEADAVHYGEAKGKRFPAEGRTVGGIAGSEVVDFQEARPIPGRPVAPSECFVPV